MAVVEWLRMQPVGVVRTLAIILFFLHFCALFYSGMTVLLEYLDPAIYTRLVSPCNLIAVSAICFKQQKV